MATNFLEFIQGTWECRETGESLNIRHASSDYYNFEYINKGGTVNVSSGIFRSNDSHALFQGGETLARSDLWIVNDNEIKLWNRRFVKQHRTTNLTSVIEAMELKRRLDLLRPISKEQEAVIMQKFRLDWNYHSNHLEGNSLTFGETKALILFNITAQGKPLKDHFEITGHNEAIKWIMDIVKGDYPLTESFIRELHKLLLKEPFDVDAITTDGHPTKKRVEVGKYKSTPNHVKTKTGEIFRFATPEETPAMMGNLIQWYREQADEANINPILLASEFHYRFIRIHPFDDGNGRVARILMNFILMKFGYPPVIIKSEDKENYFAVLQLADSGNIGAFVDYIAKNLTFSIQIMIDGAEGKSIEDPDDLDKKIVLLEKELSVIDPNEEIKEHFSVEFFFKLYDSWVKDILKGAIETVQKFNHFFTGSRHSIFLVNVPFSITFTDEATDTLIEKLRDGFVKHEHRIYSDTSLTVNAFYLSFKKGGLTPFGVNCNLSIKFDMTKYTVIVTDSVNGASIERQLYQRLLHQPLSPSEIRKVITEFGNGIFNSIEYLSREIRSGKG